MKLKEIKKINSNSRKYDIQTKSSNFFANNILIHNSTAIFDFVNGQFSCRTRDTFSAATQLNALDFEKIHELYPDFVKFVKEHPEYSYLCEIVTPNNQIVIRYPEVEFYLIGAIYKECNPSYYLNRQGLDRISEWTGIKRPKIYDFKDLPALCTVVEQFKGIEGVVLSYCAFQNRIKIKATDYLVKHRFLSNLSSENNLIDLFLQLNRPIYPEFYSHIEKTFDFEIAETVKDKLVDISLKYKDIFWRIEDIKDFVKSLPDGRKECAELIIGTYQDIYRSICFMILDNREIDDKVIKKLLIEK